MKREMDIPYHSYEEFVDFIGDGETPIATILDEMASPLNRNEKESPSSSSSSSSESRGFLYYCSGDLDYDSFILQNFRAETVGSPTINTEIEMRREREREKEKLQSHRRSLSSSHLKGVRYSLKASREREEEEKYEKKTPNSSSQEIDVKKIKKPKVNLKRFSSKLDSFEGSSGLDSSQGSSGGESTKEEIEKVMPFSDQSNSSLGWEKEMISSPQKLDWMFDEVCANRKMSNNKEILSVKSNQKSNQIKTQRFKPKKKTILDFFFLTYPLFCTWEGVVRGIASRWTPLNSSSLFQVFSHWKRSYYKEDWEGKEEQLSQILLSVSTLTDSEVKKILRLCAYRKGDESPFLKNQNISNARRKKRGSFTAPTLTKKSKKTSREHLPDQKEREEEREREEREEGKEREREREREEEGDESFGDWEPEILANQLCLFQIFGNRNLFSNLPTRDFLKWNSTKQKQQDCPKLWEMIQHFNELAFWVVGQIVVLVRLKERIEMMEKFIKMGIACLQNNNFFGAKALYTGINHPAISRMKKTMKGLSRESKIQLKELFRVLEVDTNNGATYRALLKTCEAPMIPHLGLHMKDLVFLLDGNLDKVDGLINFGKFYHIWEMVWAVRRGVLVGYPFMRNEKILSFLRNLPEVDADTFFQSSNRVEPKDFEALIATFLKEESQKKTKIQQLTATNEKLIELQKEKEREVARLRKLISIHQQDLAQETKEPQAPI